MSNRKLPRSLRKANFIFKVLLAGLSGINVLCLALNSSDSIAIPTVYFEIMSVACSALPVIWSNFLDKCKEYVSELTPAQSEEGSVKAESPKVDDDKEADDKNNV